MKITHRQREEIDFLIKEFCKQNPTDAEIKEFIDITVHGKGSGAAITGGNPLLAAKKNLDISVKMWREDLTIGLISKNELIEDFASDYGTRLVESILNSVTKEYRLRVLEKHKGESTVLAFSNFGIKMTPQ